MRHPAQDIEAMLRWERPPALRIGPRAVDGTIHVGIAGLPVAADHDAGP